MGRGGNSYTALTDAIRTQLMRTPEFDGKRAIPERFTATVARLAEALEGALPGSRVSHHERPVMLMPHRYGPARQYLGDEDGATVV